MGDLFGGGIAPGLHELQVQAFTSPRGGGDLLANAFFTLTVDTIGGVNLPPNARDDGFADDFAPGPLLDERQYALTLEAFTERNGGGDLFSVARYFIDIDFTA